MAPFFQMVNVMDEEEPADPRFAPDGLYYPRILFISKCGQLCNVHGNKIFTSLAFFANEKMKNDSFHFVSD